MVPWKLPAELSASIANLSTPLHGRHAGRLLPLLVGLLFAQGRRTVTSWLRAVGIGKGYQRYYYFLGSLGRKTEYVAALLLRQALAIVSPGERLLLALDDTPTKRSGPLVEGAGIHHNPTPGPADQKFLYGHIWVTLAWVVQHPLWGALGLPLRALLYVRQKDIPKLMPWYKIPFQTKLQQAATLVTWAAQRLKSLGKVLWVVADGAYAKRLFLKAAQAAQVVVVSRLRKDAALWSLPKPPRRGAPKRRGKPPTYGKQKLSLAKRAAHKQGWQTIEVRQYGKQVTKRYKTFLATYKPAGGLIRVVLVREDHGWVAFFCTDAQASVTAILEAVADRAAVEQDFHDLKEVHGVGQAQVRNYWANIAVYHLGLWLHTLIELWAWAKSHKQLVERGRSPWDEDDRRPSHADRRNALRRACLREEFRQLQRRRRLAPKIRDLLCRLLGLVV
jgi:DDE superfamily endonuclease